MPVQDNGVPLFIMVVVSAAIVGVFIIAAVIIGVSLLGAP
jgi:hypothetical protein